MAEPLHRLPIDVYRDPDGTRTVVRVNTISIGLNGTGGEDPTVPLSEVVSELHRVADELASFGSHWIGVEQIRVLAQLFENCREQLVGLP